MTNQPALETLFAALLSDSAARDVERAIADHIGPMGHKHWPGRRVHKLPRGYTDVASTITDESIDRAFADRTTASTLALVAAPYARVAYAPMTRASLLDGCDEPEECPPTLRSYK